MSNREMAAEIEIGHCSPPDGGKFGLPGNFNPPYSLNLVPADYRQFGFMKDQMQD